MSETMTEPKLFSFKREQKQRLNRINHWVGVRADLLRKLDQIDAKLRDLGHDPSAPQDISGQ